MTLVRVLTLALVTVAAYANSLNGPLLLDDNLTVLDNPQIRELWSRDVLFPERELPTAGRPLANLTFAINYAIHGAAVAGYHAVNLALHAGCALLLFAFLRRALALPKVPAWLAGAAPDVAFATALLWAVHPLNSEIVNYVTQRTEALMTLFFLFTLYASLRALGAAAWRWAAIGACLLGALSKESIATVPLLVVLIDRLLVFDSWRQAWRTRRGLYFGLAASWLVLAAIMWTGPRIRSAGFATDVTVWNYLLNQTVMISRYLMLTVWPRPLVVTYGWPQALTLTDVLPYALLVVGLLAATVAAFRYRPLLALAGAWLFVTLAPASSVVPIATEVGAERRMYLPLMALLVVLAAMLWRTVPRVQARWALVAVLTIALGAGTLARNREYADEIRLAELTLARWPSGEARHMLGELLVQAGRAADAEPQLRRATAESPRAHYTLGMLLYQAGRLDEAVTELTAFVERQPLLLEVPEAQLTIARAYGRQQRWALAETQAAAAVAKAPGHADARLVLAEVLFAQEKLPEATSAYLAYVQLRPTDTNALTNLGILLVSGGRLPEALAAFRRAADSDPGNGELRRNYATALLDAGQIDQAAVEARQAVALRPDDPVARALLEQALARQAPGVRR
jgi:tetratricopeptide (TPR) repeat protein